MTFDADEDDIVEAFEKALTFQSKEDNGKSFILPSHPETDEALFNEVNDLKNNSYFARSIYNMYVRRQYYYSREVWAAIRIIDELHTPRGSSQQIQKLNLSKSLKNFVNECEKNPEEIGLALPAKEKERELIDKRNFGALSEVTTDIIAHAVLSKYNDYKDDKELKGIFPTYILKILRNDIVVYDPSNKLWALKHWLIDLGSPEEWPGQTDEFLTKCLEKMIGHHFVSPTAKGWDSTPEIYTNERATMYSLINLLNIKKYLIEKNPYQNVIRSKIDEPILQCVSFIESSKKEIFENPYLIALYIRYKLAKMEVGCSDTELDTIKKELLDKFVSIENPPKPLQTPKPSIFRKIHNIIINYVLEFITGLSSMIYVYLFIKDRWF